jgi:hypothetical protein
MTNIDPQDLADRYIALWTEPDAGLRRKAIEQLWAEGGAHILQPPVEIREVATGLGFDSTTLEAYGYDALEVRVTRSYERFVGPGSTRSGRGTTPFASTTSSSSPGRWCLPTAARRQAAVWKSSSWTAPAVSRPTTCSPEPDEMATAHAERGIRGQPGAA